MVAAAAAAAVAALRWPILYNWRRLPRRNVEWVLEVTDASFASLLAAMTRVKESNVEGDDGIIPRNATRIAMVAGRAAARLIIVTSYGYVMRFVLSMDGLMVVMGGWVRATVRLGLSPSIVRLL